MSSETTLHGTAAGLAALLETADASDKEPFSIQRRLFALSDEISDAKPAFFTQRPFLLGELHLTELLESWAARFDLPGPFADYLEQRRGFISS